MKKPIRMTKLEDNQLWRMASEIMLYAYDQLPEFTEDEEYGMEPKLRDRSFDLTCDLAEAAGSLDPRDKTYYYGLAMRDVYGIRNTLIMASKTQTLNVEPSVFLKLERLADGIADEVSGASDDIPEYLRHFSVQEHKHES